MCGCPMSSPSALIHLLDDAAATRATAQQAVRGRGSKPGHTWSWVGAAGVGDSTFGFSPVGRVWTEVLARTNELAFWYAQGRLPFVIKAVAENRRFPTPVDRGLKGPNVPNFCATNAVGMG